MRKLIVAGIAALMLIVAAPASAAPRTFFGLTAIDTPTESEFQRLGRGNVGTFRANLFWAAVEATPGSYDWSGFDALVGNAAANGIRVFPTIFGSPTWAAAEVKHPPRAEHLDELRQFAAAAANRYGPGGEFWTDPLLYQLDHFGGPVLPVVEWQIWNEINSPNFWLSRPRPRQYKPVLAAARDGLKSADPGARVVLGGLFRTAERRGGRGLDMQVYMRGLYRSGARGLFDAVAIHPYARTPRRAIEAVREARRVMKRFRDGRKAIWLTEVGWATSGKRTPVTVKPRRQARYLRRTFRLSARNRKRLRITGVIWYSFKDRPERLWLYRTGLFTQSLKPKPSWRAFVRLTGGRP